MARRRVDNEVLRQQLIRARDELRAELGTTPLDVVAAQEDDDDIFLVRQQLSEMRHLMSAQRREVVRRRRIRADWARSARHGDGSE